MTEIEQYKDMLRSIATYGCDGDSKAAARVLKDNDAKAHACHEMDFLFIGSDSLEMDFCTCEINI